MTEFSVIHEVKCPRRQAPNGCGSDLTQEMAVEVHFVVAGKEFDLMSSVDEYGHLRDPSHEGLIAKGCHGGSACAACGEQLEELVDDDKAQEEGKNWYVLWEETGKITGPFFQDEALELPITGGGLVFSSKIFEPEFVTTPEVEELLRIARDMQGQVTDQPKCERSWLQRAIDALTLLSRKTELPEDVSSLESFLLEQSHACPKDEENHGSDWIRKMKLRDENMKKAAETLTLLSREKLVECSVEGGVTEVIALPLGVRLMVYDYDTEGYDTDRISRDDSGRECVALEFTNERE